MASKGAEYMRRQRAVGKAWDQRPENRERVRERKRRWISERRRERIDAGLCANCGQPKLSEWYCWDCLNKKEDWYWSLSGFEYNRRLLHSRRLKALKRMEQREQRRQEETD
jgi:ribosomal protein L32